METVIAIGVLAVLLSAFLTVFGPATAGIRRALSAQEADRLASTLEKELGTLRPNESYKGGGGQTAGTAFDKAFDWIKNAKKDGNKPSDGTILIYQYRADPTKMRDDGSLAAYSNTDSGIAGSDYIIQSAVRRRKDAQNSKNDDYLKEDLKALEGRVFVVCATQLVFKTNGLELGESGQIKDPKPPNNPATDGSQYPEAVIAFSADFYAVPSTAYQYITGAGFSQASLQSPIFTRNLAARR